MDDALIERAKSHAKRSGKSLSRLVADYLRTLTSETGEEETTPLVSSLVGALGNAGLDESDYRAYLETKHLQPSRGTPLEGHS